MDKTRKCSRCLAPLPPRHRPKRPPAIDRTAKLYIGGKQSRPDSGYSYAVTDSKGKVIGQAGLGNRKDIRNAVEAALKASAWSSASAHNRAQVLVLHRRKSGRPRR